MLESRAFSKKNAKEGGAEDEGKMQSTSKKRKMKIKEIR